MCVSFQSPLFQDIKVQLKKSSFSLPGSKGCFALPDLQSMCKKRSESNQNSMGIFPFKWPWVISVGEDRENEIITGWEKQIMSTKRKDIVLVFASFNEDFDSQESYKQRTVLPQTFYSGVFFLRKRLVACAGLHQSEWVTLGRNTFCFKALVYCWSQALFY